MPSTFKCPHCFADNSTGAVAFRCSGDPAPNHQKCVPWTDPEREKHLGDGSQTYPPVLKHASDGRHIVAEGGNPVLLTNKLGHTVKCDRCDGATKIAICPQCHVLLPRGVEDKAVSVAVVGPRNSGKTVFLSQLDHQMMSSVPERFGVALEHPGGTIGLARKLEEYRNNMAGEQELPEQTRVEGQRNQAPAVYRWEVAQGRKQVSKVISVYDTPGEAVAAQQQAMEQGHLRSANAVVLVVDPFSLSENRELAIEKGIDPGPENLATDVLDGLVSVLKYKNDKRKKISIPLAVVVTKMDAFWNQFPENSPLRTVAAQVPYFDDADSTTVHDFVDGQLRAWGGTNLANKINMNFQNFRYFSVSALGDEPSYRDGRLSGAATPTRVVDPLLWILSLQKNFLNRDSAKKA